MQALQLHASLLGSTGKFDAALEDLNSSAPGDARTTSRCMLQIAMLHQAAKQPHKATSHTTQLIERIRTERRTRLSRPGRRVPEPGQAGRARSPITKRR